MLPLSSVELIHREAEQTGKPTYHSYSSIPIEQESGPRAGQSEMVKRDKMAGNRRGGVDNTQKHQSTHVRGKAHRIAALESRVKEERHWAKVPEGIFNFQSTVTSLHFVKTWFALSFHRKVQVQSLRNDTSFIFITSSLIKRILVRAFFCSSSQMENLLPGKDRSPGGSLSVLVKLLCSLMQSCRMSPPECILSSGYQQSPECHHCHSNTWLFTENQRRKLTFIWRQGFCHVLSRCGLEE